MSTNDPGQTAAPRGPSPSAVGERVRQRRLDLGLSIRELARRLSVSPSLISQIERGKATPSVGTLYAITSELGISLDALFSEPGDGPITGLATDGSHPPASGLDPVVRPGERKRIALASGVRWERLTRSADPEVDFLYVTYEPGGASCEEGVLMRHAGKEYGHVLSGRLAVTVGFDEYLLGPGDSISFESTSPHRLATVGHEPVHAIWIVVGRLGDPRFGDRDQRSA
ncbi:MAG: cupin domain-containing protein [Thermoleophilaceae bacterium]|nr:cupin domain-containing protein [Thermoleophilaceae bacterium]